jgi:hypothetical protein
MSTKFVCDTCLKEFVTKGNLVKHLKNPCSIEGKTYICTYCDSNLKRNNVLVNHMKQCPRKGEYEVRQLYTSLQKDFEEYKAQKEQEILDLKSTLQKSQQEYELYRKNNAKAIEAFKECVIEKDKKLEFLRGKIKVHEIREQDYMKQERSKQVNITNINNNNTVNNLYIQNLEPITDELIRETGKKVGMMDLKEGAPGIMRKFQPVLKNKIICTDASRNSLMYNYNGKLKRDTRGQMITDKIMSSTEPQYRTYKEEIDNYYKNLDPESMTEVERAKKDYQFDNYKEYSRAMNSKNEFGIKKVSKRVTKTIVNFSKSKSQFEAHIEANAPQQTIQEQEPEGDLNSQLEALVAQSEEQRDPFPVEPSCRFNKVVSRRQTLFEGRVYELHLDAEGRIVHKFRIRSSGEPYLTDEETDPESRDQSDDDYNEQQDDTLDEAEQTANIEWPEIEIEE